MKQAGTVLIGWCADLLNYYHVGRRGYETDLHFREILKGLIHSPAVRKPHHNKATTSWCLLKNLQEERPNITTVLREYFCL